MLRLFLQKGAYFSAHRIPGLRCAVQSERLDIFDLLVQQPSFDPHYQDLYQQNALQYVSNAQTPSAAYQMAHRLVDHGVPINVVGQGITPLAYLVVRVKYKPAMALLERGADPYFDGHNQRMCTLGWCFNDRFIDPSKPELTKELREDRRKLVALFIAKGADVNRVAITGDERHTPLCWALMEGKDVECIRILLDAGASITDAVTYANGSRTEGLLRMLFCRVAGFNPWVPREETPSEASFEPCKDSVHLLLENGARIDSVDDEVSALGICCRMSTPEVGNWALEFLVDDSTRRNATPEFVEYIFEDTEDEAVRTLLGRLRDKSAGDGEHDEAETADE
ncbi:hypothetical protein LCI18_007801 [Fusarium solani-melongenae]|uniref:Uncharacterized protein n=1 Tax=Fusarium solani subsp. cucurbitae TaxID=2747967 RepID=A0ACD3Z6N9_FUSSC|nr:hypothetical protein LCI18_007801 [Fusarium solani-melongenae]